MASACTIVLANDPTAGAVIIGSGFRAVRPSSCALMTVALAAACVLVVTGVLVVREYALSAGYEPASNCRIADVSYAEDAYCQHCTKAAVGKGKNKDKAVGACSPVKMPCLIVAVIYEHPENSRKHRAILHADSLQAAGAHSQCSYSVCLKSREDNQRVLDEFADQWRVKAADPAANDPADPFDCFYDVSDLGSVIPHKTYSRADVVHCMLWPSLVVVASVVAFLYLEARRSRLTFCGTRPSTTEQLKHTATSSSSSSQHASKAVKQRELLGVNDVDHQHGTKLSGADTSPKVSDLYRQRHKSGSHLSGSVERLRGQVHSSVDVSAAGMSLSAADGPSYRRAHRSRDHSSAASKSHSTSSLAAGVDTTVVARPSDSGDDRRAAESSGRRQSSGADKVVDTLDSTSGRCVSESHLHEAI